MGRLKKKKSRSVTKPVMAAVAAGAGLAITGVVAAKRRNKTTSKKNGKVAKKKTSTTSSRRAYHLVPNGDGWVVKPEGSSDIVIREDTKKDALETAGDAMSRLAPSQLVIHRKDGTIEEFRNFEPAPATA